MNKWLCEVLRSVRGIFWSRCSESFFGRGLDAYWSSCASVSLVLLIWKQNSCVSHWGGISKPLNSFCLLIIKVIFHLSGSDFSICSTEENRLDCCQHHFFFFLLWLQWLICFLSFLFFQYYKWVSSFLKLVLCLLCMAEESKADLSASPSTCHLETYTYSF